MLVGGPAAPCEGGVVDEPLTENLLEELLSSPSVDAYVETHDVGAHTLSGYLSELLDAHGLVRSDVIREAGLNETYGYELFVGKKDKPGRDKVLQLAFAMGLSLRETERLLRAAGASRLYVKDRRDAIIIFCLSKGAPLQRANEELYARGEATLG